MKYAVTDIGANTVKISIYSVENGAAKHIVSQSTPVGLAGYVTDGVLSDTGISELAAVVSDYEKLAETVSADGAFYIATASLRNISNGEYAVSEVFRRTGIRISVISGEREAELGFTGFLSAAHGAFKWFPDDGIFADMGGGSTELVSVVGGSDAFRISLPFGALKLYNRFVSGVIPTASEVDGISRFVRAELRKNLSAGIFAGNTVYLTGGTAKAAGKAVSWLTGKPRGNMAQFTPADFSSVLDRCMNESGCLHFLASKIPDRIHMLIPGLCVFSELFRYAGTERVFTVYSGIRDGFIYDMIRKGTIC